MEKLVAVKANSTMRELRGRSSMQFDDGYLRTGVALSKEVELKNRVALAPFRTFREVEQPMSEFIFRVRKGGQCALFEADGGAWKLIAVHLIKEWLSNNLRGTSEDLAQLPVVA